MGIPWTEEETEFAKQRWIAGLGSKQIAAEMTRSYRSIKKRMHVIGVARDYKRPSKWTEERTEYAKAKWMEGYSAGRIAKDLGCFSRTAVIGKMHHMGVVRVHTKTITTLSLIRTKWSADQDETARKLWGDGCSAGVIAKEMNLSRNAVMGRLNRLGLTRSARVVTQSLPLGPRTYRGRLSKPVPK